MSNLEFTETMHSKATKKQALPEGWREVILKDTGRIITGTTPPTSETRFYEKGIYPFVTPTDIDSKRVICKTGRYLTNEGLIKGRVIPPNSLLVTCIASIGKNAILNVKGSCNQQINAIIPNKQFDIEYLYYLMENSSTYLIKFSGKSATSILNKNSFSNLIFTIPPLPEQKAIASLLKTWDTTIEKTETLIAAKEKRFKWLLKTLISDQQDNRGWKTAKLGEICKLKKGEQLNKLQMTETGKYPALNGGISLSGYTDRWNTPANTVTISEGGNSCGYVNFNTRNFWAGSHCYTLIDLISELNIDFLYYQLKGKEQTIMKLRVGSGLPNIQKSDVANFHFALPSQSKQKRIAHILKTTQKEIGILKNLTAQYRTQKRGLMQKLLTGESRIKL